MQIPKLIHVINNELCVAWDDGREDYFPGEFLRLHSPSAENKGEKDIFGNHHGPQPQAAHPDVSIEDFEPVGNYAIKIRFSDKHQTGLYSWEYLKSLSDKQ